MHIQGHRGQWCVRRRCMHSRVPMHVHNPDPAWASSHLWVVMAISPLPYGQRPAPAQSQATQAHISRQRATLEAGIAACPFVAAAAARPQSTATKARAARHSPANHV